MTGAHVVSKVIIVATGVAANGTREVLGLAVGDSEDAPLWTSFLRTSAASPVCAWSSPTPTNDCARRSTR